MYNKKFKLRKDNSLTNSIKKVNYKPSKISKWGNKIVLTAGVLNVANMVTVSDLNAIVTALNAISVPLLSYSIYSSIKRSSSIKESNKINLLALKLYLNGFIVNSEDLKNAKVISKDGVDMLAISLDASILQAETTDGNFNYAFYKDGEYTDISDLVNSVMVKKKKHKKRSNKETPYDEEDYVIVE